MCAITSTVLRYSESVYFTVVPQDPSDRRLKCSVLFNVYGVVAEGEDARGSPVEKPLRGRYACLASEARLRPAWSDYHLSNCLC